MRREWTRGVALVAIPVSVLALAACGGAPPRDEVRSGLVEELLDHAASPSQEQADAIAECMLDELYETVSDETLEFWASGGEGESDPADGVVVAETSMACSQEVG